MGRWDIVSAMSPRKLLAAGFLLLAVSVWAPLAGAQTNERVSHSTDPRNFSAYYFGARVDLGPDWLFAANDNPAYASPAFDDRGWMTVSTTRPLLSYGIRDIPYAWYRIHVHVSPDLNNLPVLAMEVQYISGSYELYVDGVRIGANGKMDRMLESSQAYLASYDIPGRLIPPDGNLVIAVRFALNRAGSQGPGTSTPFHFDCIYLSSRDEAQRDASYEASHQTVIGFMLCGLSLVTGIVSLALFLAMRTQVEYLAIAISLLAQSFQAAMIIWVHLHTYSISDGLLQTLALGIGNVALIEFVRLILHLRHTRRLLVLEITSGLGYFSANLLDLGFISTVPYFATYFIPSLIVNTLLPVLLLRGLVRGNRDARVVFPAIAIVGIANYWNFLLTLVDTFHLRLRIPPMPYLHLGSYGMDLWSMWAAVFYVTMLLFLVLRTVGIARDRARAAAELEAARTIQQVLIPEAIPIVPGFAIKSVYRPAGEVGGDFFQILPIKNGGVLVAIGDVSGKGMPAAMTVSLLVGTFRTLAHYTQSPGEILAAMNQRMLARSNGGFTTCLVLRADAGGKLTVANAGHVGPYLQGKELVLENGLPLGLSAETSYVEFVFQLRPNEQFTLVTDGVVEARDKAGALFGFDRTAAMSRQSADQIANAAELFGQDDDITVLTVQRMVPA